jgi:hypothetical protein
VGFAAVSIHGISHSSSRGVLPLPGCHPGNPDGLAASARADSRLSAPAGASGPSVMTGYRHSPGVVNGMAASPVIALSAFQEQRSKTHRFLRQ